MSPSRCVLLAAVLVSVSFASIADEPETNRGAARATNEQQARAVQPTPAPTSFALPQAPPTHPAARSRHSVVARPVVPAAPKAIPTPNPGTWGIVSSGDGGGGIFRDTDSEAEGWLGGDGYGVRGFGSTAGGEFRSTLFSGVAALGYGDYGIYAAGDVAGGFFADHVTASYAEVGAPGHGIKALGSVVGGQFTHAGALSSASIAAGDTGIVANGTAAAGYFSAIGYSGYVFLAQGDRGIHAVGAESGGFFEHTTGTGSAYVGYGNRGLHATGSDMGGYFENTDGTAYAHVGWGTTGVLGRGDAAGGVFEDKNSSGYAKAGYGDRGVEAGGSDMGGYFEDTVGSGYAHLGWDDVGVFGRGDVAGGVFNDGDDSGYARAGWGNTGVDAGGHEMGGYFVDSDGTGYTKAGFGNRGLEAGGTEMGGYFEDTDGSAYAIIADNVYGVSGFGTSAGGYFADVDAEHSGHAYIGIGDTGVLGRGHIAGGVFEDNNGTGWAKIGFERADGNDKGGSPNAGDYGIYGGGGYAGAYFENAGDFSYVYLASDGWGVFAKSDGGGGGFEDTSSGSWGAVGVDTYKVFGTGSVNFVQNHPFDREAVIVYAAPEGDEVATYTRGTARLEGGEARVPLGETFRWVTNPDIGLTAYLTPTREWCDLYVADKGTEEIVVRTRDGSDCSFDYLVYGLRIGFEDSTVVQEKAREAYIPSMKGHRDRVANRPDFAQHTALARWTVSRKALGNEEPPDLSHAHALRDLIQEYDPAVHGPLGARRPSERSVIESTQDSEFPASRGSAAGSPADRPPLGRRGIAQTAGSQGDDPDRDVYARSFRPAAADLASLLGVSEPVEPGDVVVIDPEVPGTMRRADTAADPTVVGVVAASPGVVLGSSDSGAINEAAIAFAGVARCKVDAEYGPVYPGDLLVTSPTPGHAMRADVPQPGTVLGKALEEIAAGSGVIRVLVMLR